MSTHLYVSSIIYADVNKVWDLVRPMNFKFDPSVVSASECKGKTASCVGRLITLKYKDATQVIRVTEISDTRHFVTYDIVSSEPAVSYSGATHTIRLRPCTEQDASFVEINSDYAADASAAVLQDGKFKRIDFIKNLRAAAEGRVARVLKKVRSKDLDKVTSAEIDALWKKYDRDSSGHLDAKEVEQIVDDFITQAAQEKSDLYTGMSRLFGDDDTDGKEEAAEETDLTGDFAAAFRARAGYLKADLVGSLDKNKDGAVDYTEFRVTIARWFEKRLLQHVYGDF